MSDATQREVARRMVAELKKRSANVVLVGSTAVVALGLYPKSSKDADALGAPGLTLNEGRALMQDIARELNLEYAELGWGTLAVFKAHGQGEALWRMDLLVPEEGPIPEKAAALIHARARRTDIGMSAIPEHIIVTKAVAHGDCLAKQDVERARDYEQDLVELRGALRAIDEARVVELLDAYPDARRAPAIGLINETFGTRFQPPDDPSVA
jgi:hypothetical protein